MALLVWQRDTWQAPAIMLAGLLCVRVALLLPIPGAYHQLIIGAIWLVAGFCVGRLGFALTGVFLALSGLSYAVLLTFGQYIKFMGATAIVADAFWLLALASIAVGGNGSRTTDNLGDSVGSLDRTATSSVAVARGEEKRDGGA